MKPLLSASLALALLLIFLAFTRYAKPTNETEVFQAIHSEEKGNTHVADALQDASKQIGHRLTGSENGHKAEQYAFDLFHRFGFKDVSFHEFEVEAWSRDRVHLNLYFGTADTASSTPGKSADAAFQPEVVSLASTPVSADVFAQVVDIGNGLKKDFEMHKDSLAGRIVLLNLSISPKDSTLHNLHRSEKAAMAIQYHAAGCIFINNVAGRILLTGTASVNGKLIPIPAVCITQEDGDVIRQRLHKAPQTRARMRMSNHSGKIKARNVVATLPGSTLPEEEIILCGHLDSWDLATGAIDNGIGSFTVLEIARIFEKLQLHPKRTIKFVTFMGEEQGLLGSRAMVAEMSKNKTLSKLRYVINLDMAGNTDGFNLSGRTEMEPLLHRILSEIRAVDTSFKGSLSNSVGLHSDHQPFLEQGIPILDPEGSLDKSVYKFYHSNKDNFSLVNPEHMKRCATFVGMMLYAIADTPELPAHTLSDADTRDFLLKVNLKEPLQLEEVWRWEK